MKTAQTYSTRILALLVGGAALFACMAPARSACKAPSAAHDYRHNGDEVLDLATGLTWKRCSVGQRFVDGQCLGTAVPIDWESADEAAGAAGGDWRVPTHDELAGLVDVKCTSPATNTRTFPNTPSTWFWSSTTEPLLGAGGNWFVNFDEGGASGASLRNATAVVRLVRGESISQQAANF
jgi:hypothetical protein